LGYKDHQIFIQGGLGILDGSPEAEQLWDGHQILDTETAEQFLHRKADERGFKLELEEGRHFRLTREGFNFGDQQMVSYFLGPDVLTYGVDGNFSINTKRVVTKATDPLHKRCVVNIYSAAEMRIAALGGAIEGAGTASATDNHIPERLQPEEIVSTLPEKVVERGLQKLVDHAANKFVLSMQVVGNPLIMTGTGLWLQNFGTLTDGAWRVTEVEHTFANDGYTTRFKATAKKAGKGGLPGVFLPTVIFDERTGTFTSMGGAVAVLPRKGRGKKKADTTGTKSVKLKNINRAGPMPRVTPNGKQPAHGNGLHSL
jgi:hypothetical protein